MARIPGVPAERASFFARIAYRIVKKRLGKVPEPMTITAHNPAVFRGYINFERAFAGAKRVDLRLKELAQLKAATLIGCPF